MFDLFKNRPADVKAIRNALLQFIKERLQKTEGGEGSNITGIYLFINCSEDERHLYEAAVYHDSADKFKNEEVQKIADDYAISLPASWIMEISFTDAVPAAATKAKGLDAALLISTYKNPVQYKEATAYINVLNGEAEKEMYMITSSSGKINIGRAASVQTADGFFRKNKIAFKDVDNNEINRAVSRQHAHIEWDAATGAFLLFADDGGIPPYNKVKVKASNGDITKILTTEIGHHLQEGDQVILGEAALLEFTFLPG